MIYLPSKMKSGERVMDIQNIADAVAEFLRSRFGGATVYPATGYFGEQKEEILVVESYCRNEDWTLSSIYIHELARALGKYLGQESIACSLDGRMALVTPGEEMSALRKILRKSLGAGD